MNNSSKKIILFSQAAGDTITILKIYHKYRYSNEISLFVVKNKSIYKFFKRINLKLRRLVFLPLDKSVNPISFFNAPKLRILINI